MSTSSSDVRPVSWADLEKLGRQAQSQGAANLAAERAAEVKAARGRAPARPAGLPSSIGLELTSYLNWDLAIFAPLLWTAKPATPQAAVDLASWAQSHGYTLRARGQSHGWAPLTVVDGTPPLSKVVLVDTSALQGTPSFKNGVATFGAGATVDTITRYLAGLDNGGSGPAPGYGFVNITAPGDLTLGGILAIGAHGTSVPWTGGPQNSLGYAFGCLSNLVTSLQAVVTPSAGGAYSLQTFGRSQPDTAALLVHLGRAFLTEASFQVVPNYYLQVKNWYPEADVLFQAPTSPLSSEALSNLLDTYGRVEVIWFPFTSQPWVKTWQYQDQKIEPQVAGPYNYPWANNISMAESLLIGAGLRAFPSLTPGFGLFQMLTAQAFAPAGAVMNGTSSDLLLYVQPTTLRVTSFGYAIQMRRADVQKVANALYVQYSGMMESYRAQGKYPVNGPVEIRFTSVDRSQGFSVAGAAPPALAATHSIAPADPTWDTVFWFDSLTIPGTQDSDEFFQELETWMASQWGTAVTNTMRPEWSKGWAYSSAGAWTNQTLLTKSIPAHYNQPAGNDVFTWAQQTLARYDGSHLYTNPLLDTLLPG